jgi:transcriptional regulator with XRE-family HTH domain
MSKLNVARDYAPEVVIGDRIKALRHLRKMSQTELGEALGVTFQQVQKYEKGVNRVSGSRLVKLAQLLGSTPNEILTGGNVIKNGGGVNDHAFSIIKDPAVFSVMISMGKLSPHQRKLFAKAVMALVEMVK